MEYIFIKIMTEMFIYLFTNGYSHMDFILIVLWIIYFQEVLLEMPLNIYIILFVF